ncbi:hypothetical protein [Tuwongella immobilis]|uniref:Uncharacterized protein n=1 Tax=Tuwongella immobilis TaxID=692036 RepID=A0A6C2YHC7_9BACT|nr:hypothetical protein [Tuwongella immobilis]VIP00651.1 unnamed protein product [Tuwongella immobilis]VTR96720.1 unnamed protein product [Tuwongella immobilis]
MRFLHHHHLRVSALAILLGLLSTSAVRADDVECTIKLQACGSLSTRLSPLTKLEAGMCPIVVDVAALGTKPKSPYMTAFVFIGFSVSGNTIIFGEGQASAGVLLECAWNLDKPKPTAQMESLKKELPSLLKNPEFTKQFPQVKQVDTSKLKKLFPADSASKEAVIRMNGK